MIDRFVKMELLVVSDHHDFYKIYMYLGQFYTCTNVAKKSTHCFIIIIIYYLQKKY